MLVDIYCCYFNGMVTDAICPQAVMEQVMAIHLSLELLEMLRCALFLICSIMFFQQVYLKTLCFYFT